MHLILIIRLLEPEFNETNTHFPSIWQRLQVHLAQETEKTQTPENSEISHHVFGNILYH